jgi:hypothetical protein
VKDNGLDQGIAADRIVRSNAMWLAEHYDIVVNDQNVTYHNPTQCRDSGDGDKCPRIQNSPRRQGRAHEGIAKLFFRSGWTQEQLAKKEGCKQPFISKRLVFGRFLGFIPTGIIFKNLTVGRFGDYWQRSDSLAVKTAFSAPSGYPTLNRGLEIDSSAVRQGWNRYPSHTPR